MTTSLLHSLNQLLANTYAHCLQTQGFHWNVTGKPFFPLHAFFGDVYTVLFEQIDTLAERVRALNGVPPSTFPQMMALQTLPSPSETGVSDGKMVEFFVENNHILIEHIKELCHRCEEHHDLVTQDLLVDFTYKLEKFSWMARSFIT